MKFKVVQLCQAKGFSVVPQQVKRYDLERAANILRERDFEIEMRDVMLLANKDDLQITFYTNGRMTLQPLKDKESAKSLAERLYLILEEVSGF
ncbi:MAG: hypothetical protein QW520_00665 [Methanomassiliicoccales archaeon]